MIHGSYLQGMETDTFEDGVLKGYLNDTDPTYKEWKLILNAGSYASIQG